MSQQTISLVDKDAPPPFGSASYHALATIQLGVAAAAFFVPDKVLSSAAS